MPPWMNLQDLDLQLGGRCQGCALHMLQKGLRGRDHCRVWAGLQYEAPSPCMMMLSSLGLDDWLWCEVTSI